ncbi:MAG: hypothetical protein OK474_06245 [Thaumarchaeota archaeon]|nr:hypothetical protein [Nitrososphaerota archaeon]
MRTSPFINTRQLQEISSSVLLQLNEPEMRKRVAETLSKSFAVNITVAQRLLDVSSKPMEARMQELPKIIGEATADSLKLGLSLANDILDLGDKHSAKISKAPTRTTKQ